MRKHDTLFKVPCRLELLKSLNSGLADFSQVGKFLTVYPSSTDQALKLARELHRATRGRPGPRIPFDARYRAKSLVYYRHGAFHSSADGARGFIHASGGRRYRDKRAPGKAVPRWLEDPFQRSRANNSKWRGLINRELLVFRAKAQRGKGGVYEALDLSVLPVRRVIVKEGRRHGETNWDGRDGYARVKHEAQVLRKLCKAGLAVPEIFREFTYNGNRYVVLERVPGRPLVAAKQVHPPRPSWRRSRRLLNQLSPTLNAIHEAGYVWRDCKPEHIFVHRGVMRLLDFEGACQIGETNILPWGSPDYLPPIYRKRFLPRRQGTLEDDYALGVIAFQFLAGEFPPTRARERARVYRRTACPDSLRERIEQLITA